MASGNKPWLVMLYLAGDNDLTEEMVLALQALQAQGPPEGDVIVAQFDPSGIGLRSQRYVFSGGHRGQSLDAYRVPFKAIETNTGDPRTLVDFIDWARSYSEKQDSKADYQELLILSGHGSGTTEDFLMRDVASADSLTINELKWVLGKVRGKRKIDILGFDACFMAMGEVAYELRSFAEILVGAEGFEPTFGWPYGRILKLAGERVSKGTHLSAVELATTIVDAYADHYADHDPSAGRSADLAALDLKALGEVGMRFKELVEALPGTAELHHRLLLAHWYAQTYKADQFADLRDLCVQIEKLVESKAVKDACAKTTVSVDGCVIKSRCSGFASQFSFGLSIYFPWGVVSPDYDRFEFARETRWYQFLLEHVGATRRDARPGYGKGASVLPPATAGQGATENVPSRRDQLQALFERANEVARGNAGEPNETDSPQAAIIRCMAALSRILGAPTAAGAGDSANTTVIQEALDYVAATDIPDEDVPAVLAARALRSQPASADDGRPYGLGIRYSPRSRHSPGSRHSPSSRYSPRSRSLEDRESWVKNMPAVVGRAEWPQPRTLARPRRGGKQNKQ